MAITGPVIVQGENMAFGDIVRHRGGGRKGKKFWLPRSRARCLHQREHVGLHLRAPKPASQT